MAQVIKRNFRRDFRRDYPSLSVQVGDDIVHTRDWSLGGFAIYDMHRLSVPCTVDDVLCGSLGPSNETPVHEFTATVVRMEPGNNMLACKFIDMSSDCFNFLEKLLRRAEGSQHRERSAGGKN